MAAARERPHEELDIEDLDQLIHYLRSTGRVEPDERVQATILAGGVSNRTVRVDRERGPNLVLKQALPKLRVEVDWFSPPERIHREALALRALGRLAPPGTIPECFWEDWEHHLLAMEAVPDPHENWKTRLLAGGLALEHVRQFARLIAGIHRGAVQHPERVDPAFGDRSYFESLRLEPYFAYTADQVPPARSFLHALIEETRRHRLTLVHGDFSPKNVLIHQGRLILLDHEVVHVGDPAFDLGFGLTHLISKAHHRRPDRPAFAEAARLLWQEYEDTVGSAECIDGMEPRVVRQTLGCLLARVRGRSTLEYLDTSARDRQATAVVEVMQRPPATVAELVDDVLGRITYLEEAHA